MGHGRGRRDTFLPSAQLTALGGSHHCLVPDVVAHVVGSRGHSAPTPRVCMSSPGMFTCAATLLVGAGCSHHILMRLDVFGGKWNGLIELSRTIWIQLRPN